jgi:hypothetical protein
VRLSRGSRRRQLLDGSERGRHAFEARRAVREAVNPFLMAVMLYQSKAIRSDLGRNGYEHVQEDLTFAYRVRVAASNLSRIRLFLVRRRLRRLVGDRWMDAIEQGNLAHYSDDEAVRIFCGVEVQLSRDSTTRPEGLIAIALQSAPYSKEVKKLRSDLESLSRAK